MSSSKGGECIDKSGENARALAWGIAYCLAYDRGIGDEALKRLRQFIESDQMPQGVQGDEISIIAEVSRRLVLPEDDENGIPQTKEALKNCRLMQLCEWLNSPRIALIMGGATKIKQYVFESAKLPEIRGASGLLDRINLRDVPALFSREPHWLKELRNSADATEIKEAEQLVRQVREWFQACYGAEPPDCEECIIYANGGEVLAFAPLKLGDWLTEAIERLYTKETLIANSVAVWRPCSLMELRFGLRPLEFWTDDLNAVSDNALKELLSNYYGGLDKGSFLSKKNFGEVTAYLALEKLKRREGNLSNSRVPKPAPRFETKLYARRCQSCERRNAIVEGPLRTWLCEPCARKKVFGQKAKKESAERTRWFKEAGFDWEPLGARTWASAFDEWLEWHPTLKRAYYARAQLPVRSPEDLDDIADASKPEGFIGVIYADGNNMGALLEELRTPADYQEFAQAVYEALMEATFTALAKHLRPHPRGERWLHPFEVLGIGGDDVFMIVPAHTALPITITIAQQVEETLCRRSITQQHQSYEWREVHRVAQLPTWQSPQVQSKVSLSAGVVIADQHTPIFFLRRLVEELLKSAKAKAKQLRDKNFYGATIDFIALKSIGMIATNIQDFRESALRRGNLYLTAKPYTVPELCTLLDAVKTLKRAGFPKSQLYKLREQIEKDWLTSVVDYLYFRSRSLHSDDLRRALDDVWVGINSHGRVGNVGLWLRRDKDEWETIFGDLVEIYDFVLEGREAWR